MLNVWCRRSKGSAQYNVAQVAAATAGDNLCKPLSPLLLLHFVGVMCFKESKLGFDDLTIHLILT